MAIRDYNITIKGLTPLILHSDSIEWADAMEAWKNDPANKKLSKAGDDRTPAWRWIGYLYHDDKHVGVGAPNLARCLMDGGAMVPVPGGRGNKTFKAQTQSGMGVQGMLLPILVDGKPISWPEVAKLKSVDDFPTQLDKVRKWGFDLIVKRAKIGASKHIRVRPIFESWSIDVTVSVWDDQITEDALGSIFEYAGRYKGIGDWRPGSPQRPGSYGMFAVESIG